MVQLFRKEAADAWYATCPTLPPRTKSGLRREHLRRETDILDVWFDSGSSHLAVLGHSRAALACGPVCRRRRSVPGWFHSSLLVGVGLRKQAPYREVASHGWVLDETGRAMSKSLGNITEPQTIVNQHGAEILRLWVASMDFRDDVRISKDMMDRLSDSYRKIRNTFRFCLANLYDFDPQQDAVPVTEMLEADQWAVYRMSRLAGLCRDWFNEFAFHKAYHAIYNFCTVELSAFYLDITKDRLYTAAASSPERRSVQTALYRVADALVRLVAPLLSFTAEEIWNYLPARNTSSVHLARLPEPRSWRESLRCSRLNGCRTGTASLRCVMKY